MDVPREIPRPLDKHPTTPSLKQGNATALGSYNQRKGARGGRKVKTGCQTCKIRHKKCDEMRPSCSQCSRTGRQCDFSNPPPHSCSESQIVFGRKPSHGLDLLRPSARPDHLTQISSFEMHHFDYFRLICAKEFALCLNAALWENLILQSAHLEPSLYHAALAISVLSRDSYSPVKFWNEPGGTKSPFEFAILRYNMAIRALNDRMDGSVESSTIAVLASILFVNLEFLQGGRNHETLPNLVSVHLRAGLVVVQSLEARSQSTQHFRSALQQIEWQVEQFCRMQSNEV